MAQRKTLTERQVRLLQMISNGSEDALEVDPHHVSTAALRRRGLVETFGRGSNWKASITDAGSKYLARVDGDDPPVPRQANVSLTEQLVSDVIGAGGSLKVPTKSYRDPDSVDYERRARLAEAHGKVPDGKWLLVLPSEAGIELRLVDAEPEATAVSRDLVPVTVPEKVARYHQVARRFRDSKQRHEVSRESLARVTKIVHAVALEAERRGWTVKSPSQAADGAEADAWTGSKDGHLIVVVNGRKFRFRLQEEGVHARGAWEEEVKRSRNSFLFRYRDSEPPTGPYDAEATGELRLHLTAENPWEYEGRQSTWSDRQSWSLEDRLPHLFREIEGRIDASGRAETEKRIREGIAEEKAEREAAQREMQWHELMEQAKERLLEEHRASELRRQAEAWKEAEDLRRYCDAMEQQHADVPETRFWLEWARNFANRLDPLAGSSVTSGDPDESPEALQAHLPSGWSAYGPEHGHSTRGRFLR